MVHLRSGKQTTFDSCRTQRCGHQCTTLVNFNCCACEDTRPVQASYPPDKRHLFEPRRVKRNYYYCQVCKKTPAPPKIDFSNMKSKPLTDPGIFKAKENLIPAPPVFNNRSPTPSPEERVELMKMLNQELRKMYQSSEDTLKELQSMYKTSENTAVGLRTDIKFLEAEVDELKTANRGYIDTICALSKQIETLKIAAPSQV